MSLVQLGELLLGQFFQLVALVFVRMVARCEFAVGPGDLRLIRAVAYTQDRVVVDGWVEIDQRADPFILLK